MLLLAQTLSASIVGVDGVVVRVEVDVAFGLPGLTIVGLAGSAVQEARERMRSALRNSGFEVPARRITINLAPADLPKEGTVHDLAMGVGVLAASDQLPREALAGTALIGELALDGSLRAVPGAMALVAAARDAGIVRAIVPVDNVAEAAVVREVTVYAAPSLSAAVAHLANRRPLAPAAPPAAETWRPTDEAPDLRVVRGQLIARRALEIAVSGRHNLVLCGPPGVGKTLLLRCAEGLLPPLTEEEAPEVSRIYSVVGLLDRQAPLVRRRPVRSPHHTISMQALVGGGPRVRPGEASLAHRGILVLDEMLQFRADALDALRGPLESGSVTIARVEGVLRLPARFMLLGAFNPCPCGWSDVQSRTCICDEGLRRRYQARLSGPLRDRLDLFIRLDATPTADGHERRVPEPTAGVMRRVGAAWCRQLERQGMANADLPVGSFDERHGFGARLRAETERSGRRLGLSPRRLDRVARMARTIADLEGDPTVRPEHVAEAIQYQPREVRA